MKFQLSTTKLRCNFLLILALFSASAYAKDNITLEQLQNHAIKEKLWQQSEWLKLLHYEGDGETSDDYKSSIRDKNFFLADDGSNNAETELLATIAGFYDTELKDDKNHILLKQVKKMSKAKISWGIIS